jgi:isoleucyl-tRNA synthetase
VESLSESEEFMGAEPPMQYLQRPSYVLLTLEDVFISSVDIPGWSVAKEGNITVALDITLDDNLRQEGMARDLVNRIQNLRKDQGLDVQDKIRLTMAAEEPLVVAAIKKHQAYICQETQALQLVLAKKLTQGEQLTIGEYAVCVQMTLQKQPCSAVA